MNRPTIGLAIAFCSLSAALPALAADVRAQLTPDLVYSHCLAAGVGSETEGTFMLPSGRVTGTVLCTDADVAKSNMPLTYRDGDDEDDDRRGHVDDDGDDREEDDDDD